MDQDECKWSLASVLVTKEEAFAFAECNVPIRAQVDFINAQLGVGFSVPIIMLDHMLSMRDIGYVVATSGE